MTIDVCTPRSDPAGSYGVAPTPMASFDLPDLHTYTPLRLGLQTSDPVKAKHIQRADEAYRAMQRELLTDDGTRLDSREKSGACDRSWVWPYGQAVAASLDRAIVSKDLDGATKALAGLEKYMLADGSFNASAGRDDDRYFDDNAWIGLDLAQAYRLTGEQKYADGARKVFEFLMQGTNDQGGVLWHEKNEPGMRPAAACGPTLQLALQLAELTGDPQYKEAAKKLDSYLTTLRTGPNGMVIDARSDDGKVDERLFTYNQGTAIGADVQMYQQFGDRSKLERAKALATATLDHFNDAELWKHPPSFNAILFRNLLKLDAVAPDPRIRATLQRYLDHADSTARTKDGFYRGGGLGRTSDSTPKNETALIDQAAFVQMHAMLGMTNGQLDAVS